MQQRLVLVREPSPVRARRLIPTPVGLRQRLALSKNKPVDLWTHTPDIIDRLRRALIIFMLSLLPFQFVWGAAASYCQHEQGASVGHFGHHVRMDQGKVLKASGENSPDKKIVFCDDDPDCVGCHLTCVPPVMQSTVGFACGLCELLCATPIYGHPQHIPSSIERPKWTLAA